MSRPLARRSLLRRLLILVMAAFIAGLALTTPTASATSPPPAPPAACDTAWCDKVRQIRKVAIRIDRTLRAFGSPMAGYGVNFARSGRRWDVNPFAVAFGLSGVESTYGQAACGFNAWGLGSCGRSWSSTPCVSRMAPIRLAALRSWPAAIETATRYVRCRFPAADSVWELHGYCTCSGWFERVVWHMARAGSGPGLRWRHGLMAVG